MNDLNRYCDLTPHQAEALHDLEKAHPSMRDAFLREGLVFRHDGRLGLQALIEALDRAGVEYEVYELTEEE